MSSADDNTERVFEEHPRSLKGAWLFLRATFLSAVILEILVTVISYFEIKAMESGSYYVAGSGTELSESGAALYAANTSVGLVYSLVSLICIVAYAGFFQRSMRNLYILGVEGLTIGPAWTWGWFFIPVANLWLPFRAARQVFEGSFSILGEDKPSIAALRWWWAVWLVGGFIVIVMTISIYQSLSSLERAYALGYQKDVFISGIMIGSCNLIAVFLVLNFSGKIFKAQESYLKTM